MKTGDIVQIFPLGRDRSVAVEAKVELLSSNGKSLAVTLSDRPSWFVFRNGVALHRDTGTVVMFLSSDGTGEGPWVDDLTHLQYTVDEQLVN